MIPGFNKHDLVCSVDLFRLPDTPIPRNRWSYFSRDGTFDEHMQPGYSLSVTDYPPREIEMCIGNHLLLDDSKETHLLQRQTVAQAVEIPNAIVFAFPVGWLNLNVHHRLNTSFKGLGVLQTGQYLLRYTLYNKSRNGPPLAKCFGQPFKIFTVNFFPGIQPTTPMNQVS